MRIYTRLSMPIFASDLGAVRRLGTTLYLRSDLKTAAREMARNAGLPLSRYIESLIVVKALAPTKTDDLRKGLRGTNRHPSAIF